MELRVFLFSIARGWRVLIVLTLLGLVAAAAHLETTEQTFESDARLYAHISSSANIESLASANALSQQVVINLAQLAVTPYVLSQAAETSGLDVTAGDLASAVAATAPTDSAFLDIAVTWSSPRDAQRIADAVAASVIVANDRLSPSSGTAAQLTLTEVQAATTPGTPSMTSLIAQLLVGGIIGLMIGVVLVVLRRRISPRFQSLPQVRRAVGADILGVVPVDRRVRRTEASALPAQRRDWYQAFRWLRTAAEGADLLGRDGATIGVTSAKPGEGRTSTVIGLALATAAGGRQVVVVDADISRPRLADAFGVADGDGLLDVLAGDVAIEDCLQETDVERVRVLRLGQTHRSAELLDTPEVGEVLTRLADAGSVVIVDLPAVLSLPDAAVLAQRVQHLLLVVGTRVHQREVEQTVGVLRQVKRNVDGVVANRVPRLWADSSTTVLSTSQLAIE